MKFKKYTESENTDINLNLDLEGITTESEGMLAGFYLADRIDKYACEKVGIRFPLIMNQLPYSVHLNSPLDKFKNIMNIMYSGEGVKSAGDQVSKLGVLVGFAERDDTKEKVGMIINIIEDLILQAKDLLTEKKQFIPHQPKNATFAAFRGLHVRQERYTKFLRYYDEIVKQSHNYIEAAIKYRDERRETNEAVDHVMSDYIRDPDEVDALVDKIVKLVDWRIPRYTESELSGMRDWMIFMLKKIETLQRLNKIGLYDSRIANKEIQRLQNRANPAVDLFFEIKDIKESDEEGQHKGFSKFVVSLFKNNAQLLQNVFLAHSLVLEKLHDDIVTNLSFMEHQFILDIIEIPTKRYKDLASNTNYLKHNKDLMSIIEPKVTSESYSEGNETDGGIKISNQILQYLTFDFSKVKKEGDALYWIADQEKQYLNIQEQQKIGLFDKDLNLPLVDDYLKNNGMPSERNQPPLLKLFLAVDHINSKGSDSFTGIKRFILQRFLKHYDYIEDAVKAQINVIDYIKAKAHLSEKKKLIYSGFFEYMLLRNHNFYLGKLRHLHLLRNGIISKLENTEEEINEENQYEFNPEYTKRSNEIADKILNELGDWKEQTKNLKRFERNDAYAALSKKVATIQHSQHFGLWDPTLSNKIIEEYSNIASDPAVQLYRTALALVNKNINSTLTGKEHFAFSFVEKNKELLRDVFLANLKVLRMLDIGHVKYIWRGGYYYEQKLENLDGKIMKGVDVYFKNKRSAIKSEDK